MKIDPATWPTLSKLLDDWLDQPTDARSHWLENLGPEYSDALPALRQLLATQAAAGDDFLRTLPKFEEPPESSLNVFDPGIEIGPYRLIRELGQGGMGVVWLAERADGEVKRPVALKLPIVSLHNRTLADRFVRERDILAQLTHPSIARLYDAGVTDQGQPYLALEYVEGEKITRYCDQGRLGLEPRLQLFLQVLRAAQYAHTNLIVHRDLKPANILVTSDGEVRLLDFGIAKLLTEGEANETELTRLGGRALTPDYASPEQIAGSTITTAADVYSLGVVLYELLTGTRPYRLKRDTRSGLEDAILEAEPERPSQAAFDQTGAQSRGVTPKRLARGLKGDLDTIALKALSKQPSQRYASADAFAQDIERYLDGEAVLAQPESAWYRTRKFVLRNKLAVASASAIIAALSIGLGVTLWEAHIAQVQTRTAETVQTFLLDIFRANSTEHNDPVKARQTTARELLDIGAKKIDGALNDAPDAKLKVVDTLFELYIDLGLHDQAVALGRRRIVLAKSVYGPVHPEVALALIELASNSGQSSFANDRPALLKDAGSILDRSGDFTSRIRARYYLAMGNTSFQTDLAGSERLGAKSVELYRKYSPCKEMVSALNLLGQVQDHREEYRDAIASLSEGVSIANALQGEARAQLPSMYAYLGDAKRHVMDMDGAEKSLRLAIEVARALGGDEHMEVLQTKLRLGVFLAQTSRPREGLALLQEATDLAVRTRGADEFFHTPMARMVYGRDLLNYGKTEEGLVPLGQSIDAMRRGERSETHMFADALELSAGGEIGAGHYLRAKAILDEASSIRAKLGDTAASGLLNNALIARARLLIATGNAEEAARTLRASPVKPDAAGNLTYPWLDVSLARAEVDLALSHPGAAIDQAAMVRKKIEDSGLAPYFKRWAAQAALLEGQGLLLTKRAPEALPSLQRAVQLGSEVYDRDRSLQLADSQIALASCLLDLGQDDQARTLLAQATAIHTTHKDIGDQFKSPRRRLEARLSGFAH